MERKIIEKILLFNKKHQLFKKKDKLILAVSGGADSIALVHIFLNIQKIFNLSLIVAHVNHKLRGPEADADEELVRKISSKYDLPFYSESINVSDYSKRNKLSIEEAGREVRYDYFRQLLIMTNFNKIATGHNANDNLETILFNLSRGTGIKGLQGIPIKNGNIIRPIVILTKREIIDYLHSKNENYCTDTTNTHEKYSRNFIRLQIVPELKKLNPNIELHSLAVSEDIRNLINFIDLTEKQIEKYFIVSSDAIKLDISQNIQYFELFIKNKLAKIIKEKYFLPISRLHLNNIFELISKNRSSKYELPGFLIAINEGDYITITKRIRHNKVNIAIKENNEFNNKNFCFKLTETKLKDIEYNTRKDIEYIDKAQVQGELILRNWKYGDKIKPLGYNHFKNVSKILSEQKVGINNRHNSMVLMDQKNIIWVCGFSLNDDYKITPSTEKCLKLEIKYNLDNE